MEKKRKIGAGNRRFLPEKTDLYGFILPNKVGVIPVCFTCQQIPFLLSKVQI